MGTTVPVTIDGSRFVSGATVSAGAGVTASNVAFVSSARLTASFVIDGSTTAGPRDVTVTNPGGAASTLANAFTPGPGWCSRWDDHADAERGRGPHPDGAPSAKRDRRSLGPFWVLGVARSLDEPVLNDATTMAVNILVADGGLLALFASDYLGGMGFAPGLVLTVTATFSDGTSAVGMVVTQ